MHEDKKVESILLQFTNKYNNQWDTIDCDNTIKIKSILVHHNSQRINQKKYKGKTYEHRTKRGIREKQEDKNNIQRKEEEKTTQSIIIKFP